MKIKSFNDGGYITGGFTSSGLMLTGPLFVTNAFSDPLEVVNKQYTDGKMTSLNAENLNSGTIGAERLPSFSGDFTKAAGSNVISLVATGVSPGAHSKVTVDAKGRVTEASALAQTDIPFLNWNKITTSKPTTLSGYGISDGVSVSGGTLVGFLTLSGDPTAAYQAATKRYADETIRVKAGLYTGDVVVKPTAVTPAGFLKCNGAFLNKTTYNKLFSVIGNSFDVGNPSPSTQFMLPDATSRDAHTNMYHYIKT